MRNRELKEIERLKEIMRIDRDKFQSTNSFHTSLFARCLTYYLNSLDIIVGIEDHDD